MPVSKLCISNSLYCLPYNSHNVSSGNLVLDQLIVVLLIFFFILDTCLLDVVLTLWGKILSWSLMRVKWLRSYILPIGFMLQLHVSNCCYEYWYRPKLLVTNLLCKQIFLFIWLEIIHFCRSGLFKKPAKNKNQ